MGLVLAFGGRRRGEVGFSASERSSCFGVNGRVLGLM